MCTFKVCMQHCSFYRTVIFVHIYSNHIYSYLCISVHVYQTDQWFSKSQRRASSFHPWLFILPTCKALHCGQAWMGLKEDIGPWSNLKRSEWYRSGGGHNFWLVIIIAHAFQIFIVMIQIVHFIQVELRAAFTSAHHPCKAAIIDFKHSNFRTNSTLVNCLKFRQWYMMDGKWSYIIPYTHFYTAHCNHCISTKPPDLCNQKSKMAHDAPTVSTPTFHQGREVLISGFLQHHLCHSKVGSDWKLLPDRGVESPLIDLDGTQLCRRKKKNLPLTFKFI